MMEKDIKVVCRKKDAEKVAKAAEEAKQEYNEQAGVEASVEIIKELSDESCVLPLGLLLIETVVVKNLLTLLKKETAELR